MVEGFLSHIRLHAHADDMSEILDKIFKAHFYEIDYKQNDSPQNQNTKLFIRYVVVQHGSCDHRIKQITNRKQERTKHVQCEQLSVRFIISYKSFDHGKCYFLYLFIFSARASLAAEHS